MNISERKRRYYALRQRIDFIDAIMVHNFRLIHRFNVDIMISEHQRMSCDMTSKEQFQLGCFLFTIHFLAFYIFVMAAPIIYGVAASLSVAAFGAILWPVTAGVVGFVALLYLAVKIAHGRMILKEDYKNWIAPNERYRSISTEKRRLAIVLQDYFMGRKKKKIEKAAQKLAEKEAKKKGKSDQDATSRRKPI